MPLFSNVAKQLNGEPVMWSWERLLVDIRGSRTPIDVLMAQWLEMSKHTASHVKHLDVLLTSLASSIEANEVMSPDAKAEAMGDIKIISHYLRCQFTSVSKALSPLLLDGSAGSVSQARYQMLNKILFEKDFPHMTQPGKEGESVLLCKDFAEFSKKVKIFERMIRLLPTHSAAAVSDSTSSSSDITLKIKQCFVSFINYLRKALKLAIKPDDEGYLETADRMWRITQEFNLYPEARAEGQTALIEWYRRASEHHAGRDFFHEARLRDTSVWRMDVTGKLFPKQMIDSVVAKLQEDLDGIGAWSEYESRAELLTFLKEQGTEVTSSSASLGQVYFMIYRTMESRLQAWSEHAWKIRQHYEKVLRGTKDYVELVKALDTGLLRLRKDVYCKKAAWRAGIESLCQDSFFVRANDCLMTLDDERIERLRGANWVHHTAYAAGETEGDLAYQMGVWDDGHRYFDRYHLRETWTLSDSIVESLHKVWKEIRSNLVLSLHSDKAISVAERVVREECFKQLQVWLSHAAMMRETWAAGQWMAAAPGDALAIEVGGEGVAAAAPAATREVNQVGIPQVALDLSALQLHRDYLSELERRWFLGLDARKRTNDEVPSWRKLHVGNADDAAFFEQSRQYTTLAREATERHRQTLAVLRAQRQAALRRVEDSVRREAEALRRIDALAREGEEIFHRAIPVLLSLHLGLSCFEKVALLERTVFYERQYQSVFVCLKRINTPSISDAALHEKILEHLRGPEYEHLRDLVPVRTERLARDASVTLQSVFRREGAPPEQLSRDPALR